MIKTFFVISVLLITSWVSGQVIGRVDKRTKEFYIPSDQKIDYRIFGYAYPKNTSQKLICFSSHDGDVRANYNNCPLGAYFDTGRMKSGDNISYISQVGNFGKMLFIGATGKKTIFYLPKSSYLIK